ncbi:hypothetical protein GCM10011512_11880 [Tersicoccus solisilvae]|uniref:Uncharacterized protein n=1 Tax=Tersicoccus solisilvae TaxID=1882339 RepID=A0ABQ1P4H2_9MICC|nr:hypothetical protein [Tersicoccus solisilvae]GGC86615.1 hypothetical protein GCM10011512_11880 [Tersicoccus solisilvae]
METSPLPTGRVPAGTDRIRSRNRALFARRVVTLAVGAGSIATAATMTAVWAQDAVAAPASSTSPSTTGSDTPSTTGTGTDGGGSSGQSNSQFDGSSSDSGSWAGTAPQSGGSGAQGSTGGS